MFRAVAFAALVLVSMTGVRVLGAELEARSDLRGAAVVSDNAAAAMIGGTDQHPDKECKPNAVCSDADPAGGPQVCNTVSALWNNVTMKYDICHNIPCAASCANDDVATIGYCKALLFEVCSDGIPFAWVDCGALDDAGQCQLTYDGYSLCVSNGTCIGSGSPGGRNCLNQWGGCN